MIRTRLIHPEILSALAQAGHGARILIADGNYPFSTMAPPHARRVFLNLCPGTVEILPVLELIVETVPLESALIMLPTTGEPQAIHEEYRKALDPACAVQEKPRFEFYEEVKSPNTCLVIATGERRRFANILLTIGVVKFLPEA